MDKQKDLISLDVAAARDANHARIRLLKAGHVQAANAALGARLANMVNARKSAGHFEKVTRLVVQLAHLHKS